MNHAKFLASAAALVVFFAAVPAGANPVTRVFKCATAGCTPARIPDSNGTTDGVVSFTIPTPATTACPGTTITSYAAHLSITHSNVGDLRATLANPAAASAVLFNRLSGGAGAGSCTGDDINATFSDAGTVNTCNFLIPAVSGNAHSSGAVSALGLGWQSGNWKIEVRDQAAGGDGLVDDASLVVTCAYSDAIFNDSFDLP